MTSILDELGADFMDHIGDADVTSTIEQFFGPIFDPLLSAASALQPSGPRRKVLLLPGILGSTLEDVGENPDRVWLNFGDRRILERLRLVPGDSPAEDVDATPGVTVKSGELLKEAYVLLQIYLQHVAGFEAIPFPFDWRRSIEELADQLFARLPEGDFSIVGHSMGCLVTRCCAQRHPEMVNRLEHAVFLAPPFKGSFVPLRVLAGEDWLNELFIVASSVRPSNVLATCPGFMEMIPDPDTFAGTDALLDDPRWPSPALLPQIIARARAFAGSFRAPTGARKDADDALFRKASIVLAFNQWTPDRVQLEQDGRPTFPASRSGDDTVPARSAWDDRALGHYEASFPHTFIPQEPSVIRGTAELLRSRGAHAGPLARVLSAPFREARGGNESLELSSASMMRMESLVAGAPSGGGEPRVPSSPAPSPAHMPSNFGARLGKSRLTNADLHWLFAGSHPPVAAKRHIGSGLEELVRVPVEREAQGRGVAERCLHALSAAGAGLGGEGFRFARSPTFTLVAGLQATPALAGWRTGSGSTPSGQSGLPTWCAEILLDATARDERRLKLPLYAQAGIGWIWLIDPREELLEVYRAENGRPVLMDTAQASEVVRLAPFAIELAVGALWRGFDPTAR